MVQAHTILLLEDEPLILLDLEFAVEDLGCKPVSATTCEDALAIIADESVSIDAAVLDVSLGGGTTCFPVARELERHGVPYILHSGDLDRHNEHIRSLQAHLIAKPSLSVHVIEEAIARANRGAVGRKEADNIVAE